MATDLTEKRRELDRVYDHLERPEGEGADAKLVKEYRALARQMADQISDMGGWTGA